MLSNAIQQNMNAPLPEPCRTGRDVANDYEHASVQYHNALSPRTKQISNFGMLTDQTFMLNLLQLNPAQLTPMRRVATIGGGTDKIIKNILLPFCFFTWNPLVYNMSIRWFPIFILKKLPEVPRRGCRRLFILVLLVTGLVTHT